MSEALRRTDDGTEGRPYGSHSICGSCRYGRVQVRCTHEWRPRLDRPADESVGETNGPVRTYHQYATCMHPDNLVAMQGVAVHPEMSDVVRCDFRAPRVAGVPDGL